MGGQRRRVIDVSGDGPNNTGIHPGIMRDWVVATGITVNGLASSTSTPTSTAITATM